MTIAYHSVQIPADGVVLEADIVVPQLTRGMVLFAHGSGSSRFSPRNRYVAGQLQDAGLATVLADLLTPAEEQADALPRCTRSSPAVAALIWQARFCPGCISPSC
jgi:hypothetical protein